jgi:hypothetical protein
MLAASSRKQVSAKKMQKVQIGGAGDVHANRLRPLSTPEFISRPMTILDILRNLERNPCSPDLGMQRNP